MRNLASLPGTSPACLAQMLFPYGFTEHFVLVAGDVGRLTRVAKIEEDRNVGRTEILGYQAPEVFRKGDPLLGGSGLGAPLQLRGHRYLLAYRHRVQSITSIEVACDVERAHGLQVPRGLQPLLLVIQRSPRIVEPRLPVLLHRHA